jgi:PAS domain S-box-containing protein
MTSDQTQPERKSISPGLPDINKVRPSYYKDAIAIALVLVSAAFRLAFLSALGMQAPFVLFFPAVILAALYGGWRSGLIATALSALLADYFWIEPAGSLGVDRLSDWLAMIIFVLSGVMVIWVIKAMHGAHKRAASSEAQALLAAEREAAAEALRKGEEKYRLLVENAPSAIYEIDFIKNRFSMVNEGMCKMIGYSEAELLAMNPLDILDKYSVEKFRDRMKRAGTGEAIPDVLEYKASRKDGSELWGVLHTSYRYDRGKIVGAFVVAQDITERKRSEDVLAFHALLLSQVREAVFGSDTNYRITYWNKAAENMFGWTKEVALGKNSGELLKPKIECSSRDQERSKLWSEGQWEGEVQYVRKDGKFFTADANSTILKDSAGKNVGQVVVCRDITERKKREADLHKLNRTLRALSRSSKTMNRAQNELEFLNDACRIVIEECGYAMAWIGYAEEDENKTVRPVASAGFENGYLDTLRITWADAERGRGPTGTAIRTGNVCMCKNMQTDPQFLPWREDAAKRGYNSSIVVPLVLRKKAFGAITIYSCEPDPFIESEVQLLTELASDLSYGIQAIRLRRALEEREELLRRRANELAAANKELESFSYSISHDLRTPLRAMKGFSSILMEDYADKLDEEAREYLSRIGAGANKMSELIEDMIGLAKISREKMDLQENDLGETAESIIAALEQSAPERKVDVTIGRELPACCDARLMKIALFNLLENAWKYSSKTPNACIEFGCSDEQGKKVFFVKDNGAGFDMAQAKKLFEPFQRLHTENQFPGTGIGLAITSKVIQRHGGKIWGKSEIGKGATFCFTLAENKMGRIERA